MFMIQGFAAPPRPPYDLEGFRWRWTPRLTPVGGSGPVVSIVNLNIRTYLGGLGGCDLLVGLDKFAVFLSRGIGLMCRDQKRSFVFGAVAGMLNLLSAGSGIVVESLWVMITSGFLGLRLRRRFSSENYE
jgi:hypothetical protein